MSVLKVYKRRFNQILVSLNMDITTDVITSQIRLEPDQDSILLATWDIDVEDADTGECIFTMDLTDEDLEAKRGWMDIKRLSGGIAYPVFDESLEVYFVGTVTT